MNRALCILLTALGLTACSDAESPLQSSGPGFLEVSSDPQGARIFVDDVDRGRITPDTLDGLGGRHTIRVQADSAGNTYAYLVMVDVKPDSVTRIDGPLMLNRCGVTCGWVRQHTPNRIRFGRSAAGPLFYTSGQGAGIVWPATSGNSYASIGTPIIAGVMNNRDTVSLGIYNLSYLVGRPFPGVSTTAASSFVLNQSHWLLPPSSLMQFATMRGIEIREQVTGSAAQEDALLVRITFRNVTNSAAYRATDPYAPSGGFKFDRVFVGFALDADVGESTDDLFSYAPELSTVFTYDATFREDGFSQGYATRPGLIGLRLIESPAGTRKVLNGWPRAYIGTSGDWAAGSESEKLGYNLISGRIAHSPDHPADTVGHLANLNINDYRIAVTAGPITLAAGDSTSITVAIALAEPVAGTFTAGTPVEAGDPNNSNRSIMRIAAALLDKLRNAATIR